MLVNFLYRILACNVFSKFVLFVSYSKHLDERKPPKGKQQKVARKAMRRKMKENLLFLRDILHQIKNLFYHHLAHEKVEEDVQAPALMKINHQKEVEEHLVLNHVNEGKVPYSQQHDHKEKHVLEVPCLEIETQKTILPMEVSSFPKYNFPEIFRVLRKLFCMKFSFHGNKYYTKILRGSMVSCCQ